MKHSRLKIERAMLVYQAGIANLFEVDCFNLAPFGRNAKRLSQADFRTCEHIARGLAMAGTRVSTAHCNQAGDITNAMWSEDLESAPLSESFRPVFSLGVSLEVYQRKAKTGEII